MVVYQFERGMVYVKPIQEGAQAFVKSDVVMVVGYFRKIGEKIGGLGRKWEVWYN